MKYFKKFSLAFIALVLIGSSLLPIAATNENALKSTHYWRVCSATWTKSDFQLPSSAPNVKVVASWAYNFDTTVTTHVWSVTNATKNILQISGAGASPKIIVGSFGPYTGDWKYPTCSYVNIPIGTQPLSIDLEYMK